MTKLLPKWQAFKWALANDPNASPWVRKGVRNLGTALTSEQELRDIRALLEVAEERAKLRDRVGQEVFGCPYPDGDAEFASRDEMIVRPMGEPFTDPNVKTTRSTSDVEKSVRLHSVPVEEESEDRTDDGTLVRKHTLPDGHEIKHYSGGW